MIADFHNDILTAAGDIAALSTEVDCCVCALFRGNRDFSVLRGMALDFREKHPRNLFFALEDIGYYEDSFADEICSLHPVYASLTWNGENALAGGCESAGRLTAKGVRAVKKLTDCGICIDCAHLNRESFADLLALDSPRLVDSHTCFQGVCRHPRNLEDWQAKEIVARGGLIGVALVGKFLCAEQRAGVEDVFRHIDYGAEKFGSENICLGTDFNGTDDLPVRLQSYSDLALLCERMQSAGYAKHTIENIVSENLRTFLNGYTA